MPGKQFDISHAGLGLGFLGGCSMFNRFLTSFVLLSFTTSALAALSPRERMLYVGKNATEAKMRFQFAVEMISEGEPKKSEIENQIEKQVKHLFGPMGEARVKAVPKADHKISRVSYPKEISERVWTVSYDYEGTIVLENGPEEKYNIVLPVNPSTIYRAGERPLFRRKNPCTDEDHNSEDDFWYFWNPSKPGCRLREGQDYKTITTSVERFENTKITYPEYDRLVRNTDGKNKIMISTFLGMDDPDKYSWDAMRSRDINADNYRDIRRSLLNMGFVQKGDPWTRAELSEYLGWKVNNLPYIEEFTLKTKRATILVRMFFGPTAYGEENDVFHWLYKDALENSSIMIYDGHSGLGGNLEISAIEEAQEFKIKPSRDYQLYFFNSCSSYTYYNAQYFSRKVTTRDPRGTKDLDIFANGLATFFSVMHDTNFSLVRAVVNWAEGKGSTSYQVLAKEIDSDNLFSVIGDDDNPTEAE
jgi:hypothetical protein